MKFLLTVAFCTFVFNLQAQNGYTVKVKLTDLKEGKVVIAFTPPGGEYTIDTSSIVENGWLIFKGKVSEPIPANVVVRRPDLYIQVGQGIMPSPSLNFILSNDEIIVEGRADKVYMATVKGGKTNDEWAAFKKKEGELTDIEWTARKNAFKSPEAANDTAVRRKLNEQSAKIEAEKKQLSKDFIKNHPSSFGSMYLLQSLMNDLSLTELESSFSSLSKDFKNTKIAENISHKIKASKLTAAGQPAINFVAKDENGKNFTLSDLRGKYVILDFWGSWCGPCRASHPHLKEIYEKYKGDGLEIIGVAYEYGSIDQAKNAWKKAINEDRIDWIHVLNNEAAEKNDIVKSYGVNAFPTKFIINREGNIVAKYIGGGGKDFDNKLKEIFGK